MPQLVKVGNISKYLTKRWTNGQDENSRGQTESIPRLICKRSIHYATATSANIVTWKEKYVNEIP